MKLPVVTLAAAIFAGAATADIPPPPEAAPEPVYERHCGLLSFDVYFSAYSADITPQARMALESAIDKLNGCAVTSIQTTAISGDIRDDQVFQVISEERTDNVLTAIAAAGIWSHEVQSDIVLSRETNRSDATIEPVDRRVEVQFQTRRPISS